MQFIRVTPQLDTTSVPKEVLSLCIDRKLLCPNPNGYE